MLASLRSIREPKIAPSIARFLPQTSNRRSANLAFCDRSIFPLVLLFSGFRIGGWDLHLRCDWTTFNHKSKYYRVNEIEKSGAEPRVTPSSSREDLLHYLPIFHFSLENHSLARAPPTLCFSAHLETNIWPPHYSDRNTHRPAWQLLHAHDFHLVVFCGAVYVH